jgi:hypothetical protein
VSENDIKEKEEERNEDFQLENMDNYLTLSADFYILVMTVNQGTQGLLNY